MQKPRCISHANFWLSYKLPNEPPFTCPIADGIHLRVLSSPRTLPRLVLPYINDRKKSYGYTPPAGCAGAEPTDEPRQKIVVEFSSPNMASEFHASHLRSTIVGAFVANMYESFGWDVVRMNYLGDWGKQIGLLAAGWQRFGSEEEFAQQPARHLLEVNHKIEELFEPEKQASKAAKQDHKDTSEIESQGLYAERDAFFKKMEDQDPEAIALWQRFRDATVDHYTKSYARLGITFDEYSGESTVTSESVAEVEAALKEKGVYEESDGSWIIDFAKYNAKGLSVAVVRYRNGTTSYLLRDIAAVLDRYKTHSFDKMIYVVGEQEMHFNRVIKTLELMGKEDLAKKLQHVQFAKISGLVEQLKDAHLLDDYLDGSQALMEAEMPPEDEEQIFVPRSEDVTKNLGFSGLFVQDLNHKRTTGYSCDVKRMTAFDGDTGVAYQNCYARLVSVLQEQTEELDYESLDFSKLETEDYTELLRIMAQYPDTAAGSFKSLEPSLITSYIGRLVDQLMITLDDDQEQDWSGKEETVKARMALYGNAKQVLDNALSVLGLTPLNF